MAISGNIAAAVARNIAAAISSGRMPASGGGGDVIPTPEATPALGSEFEGGFYAGLIWNEVTQSTTSASVGTGDVVLTVPDMSVTPLFYVGQQVEVRSRADVGNRMVGTVSAASGTSLTVSVASVVGSGTHADWSIMSRYRVIVAPKATGENASIAISSGTNPATLTASEGSKSTAAMVAAGNSTAYPAAHWANDLSIAGYEDWYVPARDELELAYRNLKPESGNNYISDSRAAGDYSFGTFGAFPYAITSHPMGNNLNSEPPDASGYTAGDPAQTSVAAFQAGGSEAFGSGNYWTSTPDTSGLVAMQTFRGSFRCYQSRNGPTTAQLVRAFRRSII